MTNVPSFTSTDLNIFFQSKRANVDDNAAAHLVQFIQAAKQSLDVAIYDLKEPNVLAALKAASSKVRLRIRYDGGTGPKIGPTSTTVDPKSPSAAAIKAASLSKFAESIHDTGFHLMHNKYIIRDGTAVWTGSGNFTNGGLHLQDNNFITIVSQLAAAAYAHDFEALAQPGHDKTHAAGATGKPTVITVGSVKMTLYFSTQFLEAEGVETTVIKTLSGAKKVRVIAMLVSDAGILQALQALKAEDIRGVVDPHEMKQVMKPSKGKSRLDPALFWFANGDPRFVAAPSHAFSPNDQNDFMHNKVLIIDDKIVIAGSYNFSENAELNDENMLVIESAAVAGAYTAYFDALFAQYKQHGAPLPPT
jgi:phosphatidylserine/phosphatidylglycerophosphate/cardiolipin synthase-like enzyme